MESIKFSIKNIPIWYTSKFPTTPILHLFLIHWLIYQCTHTLCSNCEMKRKIHKFNYEWNVDIDSALECSKFNGVHAEHAFFVRSFFFTLTMCTKSCERNRTEENKANNNDNFMVTAPKSKSSVTWHEVNNQAYAWKKTLFFDSLSFHNINCEFFASMKLWA